MLLFPVWLSSLFNLPLQMNILCFLTSTINTNITAIIIINVHEMQRNGGSLDNSVGVATGRGWVAGVRFQVGEDFFLSTE
jgi:hypothetical protein